MLSVARFFYQFLVDILSGSDEPHIVADLDPKHWIFHRLRLTDRMRCDMVRLEGGGNCSPQLFNVSLAAPGNPRNWLNSCLFAIKGLFKYLKIKVIFTYNI